MTDQAIVVSVVVTVLVTVIVIWGIFYIKHLGW